MSILSKLFRKPETPHPAAPMPVKTAPTLKPSRTGWFSEWVDWSTYGPTPPEEALPDLGVETGHIEARVAVHAEAGSIDEAVADLLDREIHQKMEVARNNIEQVYRKGLNAESELHEQALVAQRSLHAMRAELYRKLADASRGYERDYLALTGELPASGEDPKPLTAPPVAALPPLTMFQSVEDTDPAAPTTIDFRREEA